jgi:putative flippase GtrA
MLRMTGDERGDAGRAHSSFSASRVALYLLFAAISTVANLVAQELTARVSPVAPLTMSILVGTVVGFATKYVLDKKWIFADPYAGRREEFRKIWLYGAFSVLTTLIFWSFEVAFWTVWGTSTAKYSGAVLGLAIGYALKFVLDRTYTFRERRV